MSVTEEVAQCGPRSAHDAPPPRTEALRAEPWPTSTLRVGRKVTDNAIGEIGIKLRDCRYFTNRGISHTTIIVGGPCRSFRSGQNWPKLYDIGP